MKSTIQDKANLVNSVFSKVYRKYDLMNDVMSFGVHRLWKKNLIDWMKPQPNTFLIDVASGTGDLAHIFSKKTNYKDNSFDFYTISYGIRNVGNINLCLKEAYRVLKIGGRFMCLEFSKIENEMLNKLY